MSSNSLPYLAASSFRPSTPAILATISVEWAKKAVANTSFGTALMPSRIAFQHERVAVEPIVVVVAAVLLPEQVRVVAVDELDPSPGRLEMLFEHPPCRRSSDTSARARPCPRRPRPERPRNPGSGRRRAGRTSG